MIHDTLYTIRAFPQLVSVGEYKGYLDHISFMATRISPSPYSIWSRRYDNDGMYPEVFCHLMSPAASADVLMELRNGRAVSLPGFYTVEHLEELGFDDLDSVLPPVAKRFEISRLAS